METYRKPYDRISDTDEVTDGSSKEAATYSEGWRISRHAHYCMLGAILTALLAMLAVLTASLFVMLHQDNRIMSPAPAVNYTKWQPCGSTPAEARRHGCHFDLVSFGWKPLPCFDEALSEQFVEENNWDFYADKEGTVKVPLEIVRRGEQDMWVSWEFHVVHCLYMWRQMHRAFADRRPIDSHLSNYHHTLHCGDVLLNRNKSSYDINTMAPIIYPACEI